MCTLDADLTSGQRLMAESRHMGVEVKIAADKLDRLEAQNAKLRDLVRDLYGFIKDICELHPDVLIINNIPDWQVVDYRTPSEKYAERLYELGIEV